MHPDSNLSCRKSPLTLRMTDIRLVLYGFLSKRELSFLCVYRYSMKERAIAFDFDGTLIQGGLDKGLHIMYSSWMACFLTGYQRYINPDDPSRDVDRMLSAYVNYPGSPRFQQLSAIVETLVNESHESVDSSVRKEYPEVKELYNNTYSALNLIAAEKYWKPFPAIKETLQTLYQSYDLYIASGVTEDILQDDIDHHHFDRSLFYGIYGGDINGGSDKGCILKKIKKSGYKDLLFIGDSTKDLEYAIEAGVRFFRIKENNDYLRLLTEIRENFPDEQTRWFYTQKEMDFFRRKTLYLLQPENRTMSLSMIVDYINEVI